MYSEFLSVSLKFGLDIIRVLWLGKSLIDFPCLIHIQTRQTLFCGWEDRMTLKSPYCKKLALV